MATNYNIIDLQNEIILEDIGPWDKFKTITNDIENVLLELRDYLADNIKLSYIDSEGILILVNYLYINNQDIRFIQFDEGE